jgi:hypothetical protein
MPLMFLSAELSFTLTLSITRKTAREACNIHSLNLYPFQNRNKDGYHPV